MDWLWTRRALVSGAAMAPFAAWAGDNPGGLIEAIEKRAGGRLGVSVFDTQTGRRIRHRADERFPMCSTFKLLLVAAILNRIENGLEQDFDLAPLHQGRSPRIRARHTRACRAGRHAGP